MTDTVMSADERGQFPDQERKPLVVFCTPTIKKPYPQYLKSLEASLPDIEAAGYEHRAVFTVGGPYISHNRASMTRKALDAKADIIVYIDHDLSWTPDCLLRLIETKGDVVAGTYRFKRNDESYMGTILTDAKGFPIVRDDGCVSAEWVPAGFLKVTKEAINRFMQQYPELVYGPHYNPSIDLFNHGAYERLWYGEDYAFSRRWLDKCGPIWIVPDLNLTHHSENEDFPGNFHRFLLRQPGGSEDPAKAAA
jgi:hypothetical protein